MADAPSALFKIISGSGIAVGAASSLYTLPAKTALISRAPHFAHVRFD
jgi:hypothetical protein